ncbi:CRISPR-associated protein Cas4 [uncultured Methanofollis sp.]|uniref:CRISPR-associated protein Cas4 n=1 Tax=uncultured Methanofollis sp. TaxID=262500 RepID=UPI00260D5188|nr:CRISPR-associated protein Cas4 [uncultured Methanofollis sp.]
MSFSTGEVLILLLLGALAFFIFAIRRHYSVQPVREKFGIPEGELLYTDLNEQTGTFFSETYRISGRPDYVLRDEMTGAYVPVEVKSGRARKPYWNHILQLAAYCLLVEEYYGVHVPYGILVYGEGKQHRIEFTDELREQVLSTVAEMRRCLDGTGAPVWRNHNVPARCRGCSHREVCRFALGDDEE